MLKLIAWLLAAGAIVRTDPVLVTHVSDDATITVASIGRVRLLGLDAVADPRARERLTSLVINRWVRLEFDAAAGRGRQRAYVLLETGEFVNATLVREGLARVAASRRLARGDELERAQAEAQRFQRGIWARYTRARP